MQNMKRHTSEQLREAIKTNIMQKAEIVDIMD